MASDKRILKLIAIAMALAVCLCLFAEAFPMDLISAVDTGIKMKYESELFNTDEMVDINIIISQDDWDNMLANAIAEEYCQCDVEINGEVIKCVGIRPKGNTSLSSIASDPNTDRYSFKLEFDCYVDGQTCFDLDKLVLNNNYADATNMKEALVYDMYQFLNADASLYNYASVSVNGEYWGVYLALEAVEESFMLRNYGVTSGSLYKPDSMDIGGGFSNMTVGDGGARLNYVDDELDSYSAIWDGEVTSSSKKDHKRLINALKCISQSEDIEQYMDVDNLLRYMAVHVFSVNDDSLTGTMAHNYYLYESGGMLNIIPWDYNLAFGGMGTGNDATALINDPIDGAFVMTNFFDTLTDNEQYNSLYHAYMQELVDEYIYGGAFDSFYERVCNQLDELVKSDPTAFYSYDEYLTAIETLYQVVKLRGESIKGQLEGTIPSTVDGQKNSTALIDASSVDLSLMGVMNAGNMLGGDMNPPDGSAMPNFDPTQGGSPGNMPGGDMNPPDGSAMPNFDPTQGGSPSNMPGGDMNPPDGSAMPNFDPTQGGSPGNMPGGDMNPPDDSTMPNFDPTQGGSPDNMPGGMDLPSDSGNEAVMYILSIGLFAIVFVFVLFYKRKRHK